MRALSSTGGQTVISGVHRVVPGVHSFFRGPRLEVSFGSATLLHLSLARARRCRFTEI